MVYATYLCAKQLAVHSNDMAEIMRVNAAVGVQWVLSFLSADKKKTYCLYEAPSAEAIHEAAQRANLPADAMVTVSPEVPFVASNYHSYNGLYSASHLRPLHTLRHPWKISRIIEPFAVYEEFTTGRLWATQVHTVIGAR